VMCLVCDVWCDSTYAGSRLGCVVEGWCRKNVIWRAVAYARCWVGYNECLRLPAL